MSATAELSELSPFMVQAELDSERELLQSTGKGRHKRSLTDPERDRLKTIAKALNSHDEQQQRAALADRDQSLLDAIKAEQEQHAAAAAEKAAAKAATVEAASEQSAQEAAEALATAQTPDRPEGAADDTDGFYDPDPAQEGDATPGTPEAPQNEQDAPQQTPELTGETTTYTPGQEDPIPGEITPDDAQRMRDAAGLTADQAEAREPDGQDPDTGALFDGKPTAYDLEIWQQIVGGSLPDGTKVTIKGLPSLTLEGIDVAALRNGQVFEIRAQVRVTGFASTEKLKHNLDTGELEHTDTTGKRTLTVLAAAVVDD